MQRAVAGASRRAVVLALDFDQTLTVGDTLSAVAAAAAAGQQPGRSRFQRCADEYAKDLAAHEAGWRPVLDRQSRTVTSRGLLDTYLEALRPIEEASLRRVAAHGILAGASRTDFARAGRNVELQAGAAATINHFLQDPNFHVCIVSVNWSRDFIRGALEAGGVHLQGRLLHVYCNDPEFGASTGLSTGAIQPRLVVASDKAAALARFIDEVARGSGCTRPAVIYVGDSLTDLPLLLRADVGLLAGQSSSVDAWCRLLGVSLDQPWPGEGDRLLHRLGSWSAAQCIIDSWVNGSS